MSIFSTIFQRSQSKLDQTKLFDEHGFYGAFSTDLKAAISDVLIESPYITIRRATEIRPLLEKIIRRSVRVIIYTRNPYHHDGVLVDEAIQGIQILKQVGAKVVVCDDMRHRKLALIDGQILWEGSLNMLSQNGSKEVMRRTNSAELCSQMKQFLGIKWYSRR